MQARADADKIVQEAHQSANDIRAAAAAAAVAPIGAVVRSRLAYALPAAASVAVSRASSTQPSAWGGEPV